MKKNIVFIPNIKLDGDGRWAESRSTPYEYSIKSWRHWCDKNNCELVIYDSPSISDTDKFRVTVQRFMDVFDF